MDSEIETFLKYKNYVDRVTLGVERASKSSVVFCCIAKDCIVNLQRNIDSIESFAKQFKLHDVIVYENNSTDGTKELLHSWMYGRYNLISENCTSPPPFQPSSEQRSQFLGVLRNKYLNHMTNLNNRFDYVVVLDLDIYSWDHQGIFSSLGHNGWDMMGSNGIDIAHNRLLYYDTFSLVIDDELKVGRILPPCTIHSDLIRCQSCFGGLAVYKFDSIINSRYSIKKYRGKNGSEHCGLNYNMSLNGHRNIFINPSQIVLRLDPELLKSNSYDIRHCISNFSS